MSRRIPDALLERYLADDLKGEAKADVDRRLAASAEDRARLEALRADSAAFLTQQPPGPMVARFEGGAPRRRWAWWAALAPLVAGAAAILVVANQPKQTEDEPELSIKGNVVLVVHKKVGDSSVELKPGATVHPGDSLEFEVHGKKGFVAILSRDATGAVSVYYPFGGAEAAPFDPRQQILPVAIKLDETLGHEDLWAVWREQPFEIAPVGDALKAGRDAASALRDAKVAHTEWTKE